MSGPEPDEEREEPQGTVQVTGPGPLLGVGLVGLVLGWALRPLSIRLGYAEPDVRWGSIVLLLLVAAIVGLTAHLTRSVVRRDRSALQHHQAVNRLALGKACALVGALLAGGYLGYAMAQLGVGDPAATTRLWRSGVAAVAAVLVSVAALLLELACRVPRDDA